MSMPGEGNFPSFWMLGGSVAGFLFFAFLFVLFFLSRTPTHKEVLQGSWSWRCVEISML